jgi:hypothetical protein
VVLHDAYDQLYDSNQPIAVACSVTGINATVSEPWINGDFSECSGDSDHKAAIKGSLDCRVFTMKSG